MLTDHLAAIRKRERRLTAMVGLAIVAVAGGLMSASCSPGSAAADDPVPTQTSSAPETGSGPETKGPAGAADGVLPDHTSAFNTTLPGITKLDPALRTAVQQAEAAMKEDGISMQVTTGWRSKKYQQQLLDEAIAKYGSRKKALKWVADPDDSHHVTGHAVDIGPTDADDWLRRHGHRYGLCQTLANEIWHFELVTSPGAPCPRIN